VAVKRLNPLYPELGQWFEHEARLASQIQHPNAITIHDYGFDQGAPYIVMEYLEGRTFADIMHGDQGPGKHPFTPAHMAPEQAGTQAVDAPRRCLRPGRHPL